LQGWHEGHATGTNWDPILVVTKVMTNIAEGAGHHVPKLTAYQVRKGVIDFTLERFSLNEIAQGQAGEALQQVVKSLPSSIMRPTTQRAIGWSQDIYAKDMHSFRVACLP
jgi:hypothetical protein